MAEFSILWVLAAGLVIEALVIVYLISAYINPARTSPAMLFIQAKKKNKPILFLDNGSFWKVSIGKAEGPGFIEDEEGSQVTVHPNSIKYARGVRVGVGEYYRSLTTSPLIQRFINLCLDFKITPKEAIEAIDVIDKEIMKNVPEEKKENS